MRRLTILLFTCAAIAACSQQQNVPLSPMPMPFNSGPWQLVTSSEQRITRDVIEISDGKLKMSQKSVYINAESQFVFRDSQPITSFSQHLYWNQQGEIVSERHQIFKPSQLFKVHGKPMNNEEPLIIKNVLLKARANWLENKAS